IQIFGNAEIEFLKDLSSAKEYFSRLKTYFLNDLPCVIVMDKLQLQKEVIVIANENQIPIFYSELEPFQFIKTMITVLNNHFAESFNIFGTFLEIFGVGVMLYGSEGIGKSETALALISREHRFISDNKIKVKIHNNVLVGYCDDNKFYLESSLLGEFQIDKMYGIERVSRYHKIDLVVNLLPREEVFNKQIEYNQNETIVFRGIELPKVNIPIEIGKNIAIIIEAIVKSFLYKRLSEKVKHSD
ncbi:MAG: hypothetical protein U9N34_08920, partial [Candidatus Cloacimonadota bacterium]|nr:hypothetical protein [Candidatus Cloacimonadota bacterium]